MHATQSSQHLGSEVSAYSTVHAAQIQTSEDSYAILCLCLPFDSFIVSTLWSLLSMGNLLLLLLSSNSICFNIFSFCSYCCHTQILQVLPVEGTVMGKSSLAVRTVHWQRHSTIVTVLPFSALVREPMLHFPFLAIALPGLWQMVRSDSSTLKISTAGINWLSQLSNVTFHNSSKKPVDFRSF